VPSETYIPIVDSPNEYLDANNFDPLEEIFDNIFGSDGLSIHSPDYSGETNKYAGNLHNYLINKFIDKNKQFPSFCNFKDVSFEISLPILQKFGFKIIHQQDSESHTNEKLKKQTNNVVLSNKLNKIFLSFNLSSTDCYRKQFSDNKTQHYKSLYSLMVYYGLDDSAVKELFEVIKTNCLLYSSEDKFINILTNSRDGFLLAQRRIQFLQNENEFSLNYEGFNDFHKNVGEFLASDNSGLILFHGQPGTGKTFYIRYLISNFNKPFLYIPSSLVNSLSSPELIGFLLDHFSNRDTDFIFIIEDAEQALIDRKENLDNFCVSTLLNFADGLLSDIFQTKIICTFNSNLGKIDPALLRKGRLFLRHEFSKLSVDSSNILLKKLNKNHQTKEPMTLADIYNFEVENNGQINRPQIGFKII